MVEGKNIHGFVWIQDRRYDGYFYLADFEQFVVCKVNQFSEKLPRDHWEAIIFEDPRCEKVIGQEEFMTERQARAFLEEYVEKILKNKK